MKKSRNILKGYFESGDKPTESQFVDLIDSFFHEEDGKIVASVDETDPNNKIINFSDATSLTVSSSSGGGVDVGAITTISQALLNQVQSRETLESGNVAKNMLTVMNTNTGKVQVSSLNDDNEVVVFLTGQDYMNGNEQERIFLKLGEVYVFENLQNGSKITSSKGIFGYSEQFAGTKKSPMPLGNAAFAFTKTFFRSARNFDLGQGKIYVANGSLESIIQLTDGLGNIIQGQTGIVLPPYGFVELNGDGVQEYMLEATNPVLATTASGMDVDEFEDSRVLMPLTDDGLIWAKSGFMSAIYDNTEVRFWVRDGVSGDMRKASPGQPTAIGSNPPQGTGVKDPNYRPNGATRFKAAGLISAYTSADGGGASSTAMFPVKAIAQRVALPLSLKKVGDGAVNGLAFCSPYEGTVRIYSWNKTTGIADLWLTMDLTRASGTVNTINDQAFPAAALTSPDAAESTVEMPDIFMGGYAEADVPFHCVINSRTNQSQRYRGTSGNNVKGIQTGGNETITMGVTPSSIKAEIRVDATSGLLVKRVINNLTETWEVA